MEVQSAVWGHIVTTLQESIHAKVKIYRRLTYSDILPNCVSVILE